ncbi:TIGR01459 family HAD-type hydrolase [Sphingomonas sp.]|uniref:TIGR01459 family HAD-type hydrolase n=1 Tax=Sphingomonas sp. TaxID=28214 RepID=UPI00286EAB87|nr:TIGR01459 family HAD-type hydrolase [Sphingomonas sp.]
MSELDALPAHYRLILCDVWGCIHDGIRLLPGVVERLTRWKAEGRTVFLVTNAPRTEATIARELEWLGLPRSAYDRIDSSGEAGIDALTSLGRPTGFLGTEDDRAELERAGLAFVEDSDATDIACIGFDDHRASIADYAADLDRWAARGVTLHCLNPDRVAMVGEIAVPCAGAIADAYEERGGRVTWYGKPHPAIYQHVLATAGSPPLDSVVAIGDGLLTDMLGAARHGIAAVFVTGGIQRGAGIPADFAQAHGLGDWRPLFTVSSLA